MHDCRRYPAVALASGPARPSRAAGAHPTLSPLPSCQARYVPTKKSGHVKAASFRLREKSGGRLFLQNKLGEAAGLTETKEGNKVPLIGGLFNIMFDADPVARHVMVDDARQKRVIAKREAAATSAPREALHNAPPRCLLPHLRDAPRGQCTEPGSCVVWQKLARLRARTRRWAQR